MGCAILKVFDCKHFILVMIAVSFLMDMVTQLTDYVSTITCSAMDIVER